MAASVVSFATNPATKLDVECAMDRLMDSQPLDYRAAVRDALEVEARCGPPGRGIDARFFWELHGHLEGLVGRLEPEDLVVCRHPEGVSTMHDTLGRLKYARRKIALQKEDLAMASGAYDVRVVASVELPLRRVPDPNAAEAMIWRRRWSTDALSPSWRVDVTESTNVDREPFERREARYDVEFELTRWAGTPADELVAQLRALAKFLGIIDA